MALCEDNGYLPVLVRQLGVQEHTLHAYLAGNREDIRLANLVSFVWLTVKFVQNMDVSFKALTAMQWNLVLSERERLCTMRFSTTTRSWDAVAGAAADAEAGGAWRAPSSRRHIFLPKLPLATCATSSCGSSRSARFSTSIMCVHFSTPFFRRV
jgi:hypothetical protein